MKSSMPPLKKYSFVWVTLGFFVISLAGHWIFAWFSYVAEQQAHQQAVVVGEYLIETARDTLENWQSEFLQLIWQVAGLSVLLFIGSSQSKESDERIEEKLDRVLESVDPKGAQELIDRLERRYPKK